ncbi:hypothetical protein NHX12_003558 [Muraenolepis orangiensis]|uniref:UDENN domain-containing protein n=1 Tax=Muraenolepis orangiensis TaxID=630683 RepID=A0A9Q0DZF7_9TELE|nr:hypothetical protein NHX12_003558 [Muraenolepis orangiensis]
MPAASTMTGGTALLLCTNTDSCIYQSVNGLQCCGLKAVEAPSSAPGPQRQEACRQPGGGGDAGRGRAPDALFSPPGPPYPGAPGSMLARKRAIGDGGVAAENGLNDTNNKSRGPSGLKPSASIRDKISQWEGKKEPAAGVSASTVPAPPSGPALVPPQKEPAETARKTDAKPAEVQRTDSKRPVGRERQDSGKENAGGKLGDLRPKSPECPAGRDREGVSDRGPRGTKPPEQAKDKKSVLTHIKKLERAMKERRRGREGDPDNVYSEPGAPSINPLPKPQRTFQHHTPRPWADRPRDSSNRKSYEFEDLLQSFSEGCRADWLGLTRTLSEENVYEDILDPPFKENPYEDIELEGSCLGSKCVSPAPSSPVPDTPTKMSSKPGFFRQTSERRSFKHLELRRVRDGREAGLGSPPSRVSPPSTPSSPDDTPCLSGDPYNRRRRKIPKMVVKINAIFEARRGKKRMKRVSQSTESTSGRVTDENSESESDTEEKLKAHSQRLVSIQSMLRQTGRYRTLERDLMDLQERKLFEYFIVVALHKTKAGVPYLPEVTQQFPLKLERSFKFMRETEDQLKVIPQFCFPDAKDWAPIDNFPSETFSFVLTGEDGSRRFGYCRRLLPSGKGRRLPEILDEVEKRRAISPALVQPFMRGIMEAPFPAPGRTITVKNFLPGSGTEVIELCRPSDSRLEHVDFECLFSSLSLRLLLRVFASLLLERRVIFTADKLSTLSQCCHAVVALLYPFTWQHTYIPVLPPSMLDIVCTPTPFIVGLLSSSLPRLKELPIEEVLVVDLCNSRFLRQLDDEDSILPHKLQAALEHVLDKRKELANDKTDLPSESCTLSGVVSEAFVRFFVEMRDAFRKAVTSKSLRRFLEVFMETQTFAGFVQERELRKQGLRGLFEVRAQEYLDSLPGSEQRGVNKFLKGLGNKMKFLSKK